MEIFGMSITQFLATLIFLVVGGFVVWKIFKAILHLAVFVIAILILVYIYNHVPVIHQMVLNLLYSIS
ncbi:hypothetical protein ACED96_11900 [Clostridium thermobutyricum]|uniref:Uncharacterized protein n=1 Tax=Clostridium thermobutyricum TaxID=29372 RepID=N9WA55_9CLOT|nr:hypothetical protein [Clostridium thermobutyricum]ENY99910.1 hypothetical protein HMPREF1092_03047 [Clostridium thermobutyricum]